MHLNPSTNNNVGHFFQGDNHYCYTGCLLLPAYCLQDWRSSTGLSGRHGIGAGHNNKTTSAIIGHFRTFPTVFGFSIPKQKMLAKFTLP
jgi:hypothetical protein